MCWTDKKLLRDANGTEYLEYCELQTKTRSREEPRNIRPFKPYAFARPDGPPEKDPVFVYKFYSEKRPSSMQTVEAPYYLGINHSKDSSKCWFKGSPMGVNKLTSLMKTMAGKAGCERQLTNHSAQKRMMQKPWTITMFLQHTSCSSLVTEICRGLKITALCQKSSRKICRWFWATIQPHQTQRILLKLHKQWQLRNPHSPTVQLFLPQAHLVEPFFTGGTLILH